MPGALLQDTFSENLPSLYKRTFVAIPYKIYRVHVLSPLGILQRCICVRHSDPEQYGH